MKQEVILFNSREELQNQLAQNPRITFFVENVKYCLTHHEEDFIVFEAFCPHFDHSLTQAPINEHGQIVCPWHNFKFSVNDGSESEMKCRPLKVSKANWRDDGKLSASI